MWPDLAAFARRLFRRHEAGGAEHLSAERQVAWSPGFSRSVLGGGLRADVGAAPGRLKPGLQALRQAAVVHALLRWTQGQWPPPPTHPWYERFRDYMHRTCSHRMTRGHYLFTVGKFLRME